MEQLLHLRYIKYPCSDVREKGKLQSKRIPVGIVAYCMVVSACYLRTNRKHMGWPGGIGQF